jgi:hypothetical protein
MPQNSSVVVRCDGCGHEAPVTSRSEYGVMEDLHREACDIKALTIQGTTDDLLDLPPFDSAKDERHRPE